MQSKIKNAFLTFDLFWKLSGAPRELPGRAPRDYRGSQGQGLPRLPRGFLEFPSSPRGSLGFPGPEKFGVLGQIAAWTSGVDYPVVRTPLVSIREAPLLFQRDMWQKRAGPH